MHPTEVFESEMADLERSRPVKAWSSWLAGIGALTFLMGVVLLFMAYDKSRYRGPNVLGNLPQVEIDEPEGTIDHLPAAFRWEAVRDTQSYLVTVVEAKDDAVVLVRPALGTTLAPTAEDLSVFRQGRYRWTVDARGGDGKTKAWGEGSFEIRLE
jgi:hypothetical protein